jgi:mRNA interferase MazF
MTLPARGEVWTVDLDPVRGHEQGGRRPSLVVSADRVNESPAGLVVVVPVTSVRKRSDFHVGVEPPEGGLRRSSYLKPEDLRSISIDRLGRRLGSVSRTTMHEIETRLRMVLDL